MHARKVPSTIEQDNDGLYLYNEKCIGLDLLRIVVIIIIIIISIRGVSSVWV